MDHSVLGYEGNKHRSMECFWYLIGFCLGVFKSKSYVTLNYFYSYHFCIWSRILKLLFPFFPLPAPLSSLAKISLLLEIKLIKCTHPICPWKWQKTEWPRCQTNGNTATEYTGTGQDWTSFQCEEKWQVTGEPDTDLWGLTGGVQSPVLTLTVTKRAHDDLSSNCRVTDFFAEEKNITQYLFWQHLKSCYRKLI